LRFFPTSPSDDFLGLLIDLADASAAGMEVRFNEQECKEWEEEIET
jgi:hypothetical protein